MVAGGRLNNLYEKFGRNNYDVVFLAIDNANEPLQTLLNGYSSFGCTPLFPIVDSAGGANLVGEGLTYAYMSGADTVTTTLNLLAGPSIIIHPDRSYVDDCPYQLTVQLGHPLASYNSEQRMTDSLLALGCKLHENEAVGDVSHGFKNLESFRIGAINSNELNLSVPKSGTYTVQVFTANGRVVRSIHARKMDAGSNSIYMSTLPAGAYIVKIIGEQTSFTAKAFVI